MAVDSQQVGIEMIQAVDAVITWVNGNDPNLKAKQAQYFEVDEADGRTSTHKSDIHRHG